MFRFDFAQQIGFSVMLMLNRCVLLYIEQVIIQCLYMHIETIQMLISCKGCSTRSPLFLLFITYIFILIIHCNFMISILSFDIFSHVLAKEIYVVVSPINGLLLLLFLEVKYWMCYPLHHTFDNNDLNDGQRFLDY